MRSSRKITKKITKFPLLRTFNPEGIHDGAKSLLGSQDYEGIISLFGAEQFFDLRRGVDYAEREFLSKDIRSFTAETLETFIKTLHKYTAHSLLLLKCNGNIAGEYLTERVVIAKQIQTPFAPSEIEKYKEFSKVFHHYKDLDPQTDLLEIIKKYKLDKHPGYKTFLDIWNFSIHPAEVPDKMKEFSQTLVGMVAHNADPSEMAAYILELTIFHPFSNGNGRVARILMNCFLMSYGLNPINVDEYKEEYYAAIEGFFQDKNSIKKFMQKHAFEQTVSEPALLSLPPRFEMGVGRFVVYESEHSLDLVEKDKDEHYTQLLLLAKKLADIIRSPAMFQLILSMPDVIAMMTGEIAQVMTKLSAIALNSEPSVLAQEAQKQYDIATEKLSKLVCKRIDADYLYSQGIKLKDQYPQIGIYYFVRAADFYLRQAKSESSANCYYEAAKLCLGLNNLHAARHYIAESTRRAARVSKEQLKLEQEISRRINEGLALPAPPSQVQASSSLWMAQPANSTTHFHQQLIDEITPIIHKNHELFATFLQAVQDKSYGQALRRACTIESTAKNAQDAIRLVTILVSYKDKLGFNITEANSQGLTAYDYAKTKGNHALCELLEQNGACIPKNVLRR